MKADFTPSGGSLANLADDSAKWAMRLEQLGGAVVEQVDQLAFATNVARVPRGNRAGQCVFTAEKSHASLSAAMTFFATEYARLGQQGSLVLTDNAHTLTMANATVIEVQKVEADDAKGVRWRIRYRFGITTIVYA